ncbi:MAG TPA: maleylpyruvate isomerase N-terminal domain-containing protein [Ilumatobacteraceae bacterium]|jgi:maleylpyruvate isomerase
MNDQDRDRAGAARAHADLIATLTAVTDDQVVLPSLLPAWTIGHVATHIARNAEGHLRMFDGAARGEVAAMYPGGAEQRTADIEAGSTRSAAELLADVVTTAAELEAAWAALPSAAWSSRGITFGGEATMADLVFIRWRETSVHHADLGLGWSWSDWDPEYVRLDLARMTMLWASRKPMGLTELPAAVFSVSDHHRLAWLLGRAEIDGLGSAGIMG